MRPKISTNHHAQRRHAGILLTLGMVMSALVLGGCGPTEVALNKDDQVAAAKISLDDAKEAVQAWERINPNAWYHDENQNTVQGKSVKEVLEFKADTASVKVYDGNQLKMSGRYCKYADMNPFFYQEWKLVDFGCKDGTNYQIQVNDIDQAKSIVTALWRWKISSPQERQAFFSGKQFEPIASQYRASNPKPAITEDIRRFQVMAVSAVQEKRFGDAANDYIKALKIAPWWPQGHFNVAILMGQLHYYDEAIDHMKKYLMLVPDAPNARAAQDQIYKWQGEQNAVPST